MTLTKGESYDLDTLDFDGWTGPESANIYDADGHRNPGMDAYSVSDYFHAGVYLGPDMHGVEPVFADRA